MGANDLQMLMVTEAQEKTLRSLIARRIRSAGGVEVRQSPDGRRQTIMPAGFGVRASNGDAPAAGSGYSLLFSKSTAEEKLVNSVTTNQIFPTTYSFAPDSMQAGDVYRVRSAGHYDWGSANGTIGIMGVGVGGIAFGGVSAGAVIWEYQHFVSPGPGVRTGYWALEAYFVIVAAGVTGKARTVGLGIGGLANYPRWDVSFGTANTLSASGVEANNSRTDVNIDTTAAALVQVGCSMNWNDSTGAFWLTGLTIERMRQV